MRGSTQPWYAGHSAATLPVLAALGCGDATGPAPPDVSGLYEVVSANAVATCTPPSAYDILEPTLGHGTYRLKVPVAELGEQVRFTLVEIEQGSFDPTTPPIVGSLSTEGAVRLEARVVTDRVTLGDRTFYDKAGGTP